MAFLGGSAFAMARDVSEGYVLLNATLLKRMTSDELRLLRFEIERLLSGHRSDQPAAAEMAALQSRNRKISRLNSAVMMINNQIQANR